MTRTSTSTSSTTAAPATAAYDELFEQWQRTSTKRRATTIVEYRKVFDSFAVFVEHKPLAEIERRDVLAFRDHLLAAGQSAVTANHKIGILKGFFRTAIDYQHTAHNPAADVRAIATPQQKARVAFTADELNRLFQSEVYTQRKFPKGGGREAAYWLPLLALFTGARVEELAQLMVADVRHDDTLGHYLSITDDAAHAQLKNAASRRRIPLHPQLLDCGFLDYVARARRPGLLFPELRANGRGKLGGYFSTWFSIYLRSKVGITDSRKVFHSFRHTFKDACRAVGIEEEVHDALSGHTQQRASRRYGNEQYPLEPLFEAVSRLAFSGLDIAHLYTRPPSQRPCVTDLRMISAYHGIIVALPMPKTKKPTAPFLLAMYEGLEAGFDIAANKPIFGELPRNKQMLVNAWIELHKEELMANWHAGRLSGEFFKLDPLR
ncbi:DUF4160 domain-containing protein [Thauera sp.]|jgi:integrase|uniref:DUF4160 domain-containing protein n=1 Tax=Thauera sp. TaxID=1905334 RepID=UPI002A368F96|nr:DUF4160 domain-containing protein [Thauera sp.]MDX9886668.1 phage integrase N-terminal SAM-like domain-containing protein [Thauera sp.]